MEVSKPGQCTFCVALASIIACFTLFQVFRTQNSVIPSHDASQEGTNESWNQDTAATKGSEVDEDTSWIVDER